MLVRVESRGDGAGGDYELDATPMHRPSSLPPAAAPAPAPAPACKLQPRRPSAAATQPPLSHAGELPGRRAGAGAVLWRVACAEAAGTALLVALGGLQGVEGQIGRALAAGLLVGALVQCFVRASGGQFNPAVTAAAVVAGRMGWRRAGVEVCAQAAGGVAGAAALRASLGAGAGVVAGRAGAGATLALEALAGAVLALANSAEWDPRAAPRSDSWPLRIGATVAALTLSTEASGASMNPARHLGPALLNGAWTHCWAYWAGPVVGAVLAAAAYRLAWYPPPPPPPHPHPHRFI